MKKHLGVLVTLVFALFLAACGGSPGTSPTTAGLAPTSDASTPGTSAAAELTTATSSAGEIVVDGKGMSVYFFTTDVKDSGKSACEGPCVAAWPAVTTTSDSPAVDGVTGTVGTITAAGGQKQVTLNGLPLYYFAQDTEPGDIKGQGVNDVWHLASPDGEMIKKAPAAGY